MTQFVVTVTIADRYWSVPVFAVAESPAAALAAVQARFDEAVRLGYATGRFVATMVEPATEYRG